jgi:hypothetical protein
MPSIIMPSISDIEKVMAEGEMGPTASYANDQSGDAGGSVYVRVGCERVRRTTDAGGWHDSCSNCSTERPWSRVPFCDMSIGHLSRFGTVLTGGRAQSYLARKLLYSPCLAIAPSARE